MIRSNSLKVNKLTILVIGVIFYLSPASAGDKYEMKRSVIASSETSSAFHEITGLNYILRGSIGQALVGRSNNDIYSIQSGFWHEVNSLDPTDIIFENNFENLNKGEYYETR